MSDPTIPTRPATAPRSRPTSISAHPDMQLNIMGVRVARLLAVSGDRIRRI